MGHGPRGLQRRRQRLGLFHPRPGSLARLPVGRGRARRHLRRQAAAVLCARVVERAGPDPEGAPVRAHQQRGEPRRGRQGVLLLRRQHAHPLVHEVSVQVPAAGVSLPGPDRDEPETIAGRVRVRAARYGRVRRRPLLRRVRGVREGGPGRHPRPHHRAQSRAGSGQAASAADAVVPQHLVVGCRSAEAVAARSGTGRHPGHPPRARRVLAAVRRSPGAALHREREQCRPSLGPAQCVALRQGCVPRVRHLGPRRGRQPRQNRDQGGGALCARRAGRRKPDRPPPSRGGQGGRGLPRFRRRYSRAGSPTQTNSTSGLRRRH